MEWYLIRIRDAHFVVRPGCAKGSNGEHTLCWTDREGRVISIPEILPGEVSLSGEPDYIIPITTIEERMV